jgi:hypothetical protein
MQRLWCATPRPAWAFCAQIFDCEVQSTRRPLSPKLGSHTDACMRTFLPVPVSVPVPVSSFVPSPVAVAVSVPMMLRSSCIMFGYAWLRYVLSWLNGTGDCRDASLLYGSTGLVGLRPRGAVLQCRECRSPQVTQRSLRRIWLLRVNRTA